MREETTQVASGSRQGQADRADATVDPIRVLAEALWPHFAQRLEEEGITPTADKAVVMNRKGAAAYLGMTPNSLRKQRHPLLAARRLPGYSRPLYFREDLDAWLALGKRGEAV
jgi:hypothetical protein